MEIKQLTSQNIPQIKNFIKENPPEKNIFIYPDQNEIAFLFSQPHCKAFGVFDKDVLAGWGGYMTGYNEYSLTPGYFEVSVIYIAKLYRGKGLGELILKKTIEELKKNESYTKIFLTVSPLNKKALSLYLANGFVVFDSKKDYYGEGENRLFLSLVDA